MTKTAASSESKPELMNLHLYEKVIIVTGGASGIGESVCKKLAEEGAIPCILDQKEKDMQKIVSEIKEEFGVEPFSAFTELADSSSVLSSIDKVLLKFGKIDGLVNNAISNDVGSLENANYRQFIRLIDKNIGTYFFVSHKVLPELKKSLGSIVNICSKIKLTKMRSSSYSETDRTWIDFTQELANQLKQYEVNVNGIVVERAFPAEFNRMTQDLNQHEKLKQKKSPQAG